MCCLLFSFRQKYKIKPLCPLSKINLPINKELTFRNEKKTNRIFSFQSLFIENEPSTTLIPAIYKAPRIIAIPSYLALKTIKSNSLFLKSPETQIIVYKIAKLYY